MMRPEALGALIAAADALGIRFISDEIYHGLVYDGAAATALAFSQRAIVINSFSKYYCMTGWRIGWMVLPEELVRPVERIAQNLYISPPDLSQRAAIAAFEASAGARGGQGRLCRQPPPASRAPAGDRLRRVFAGRRRLLRLCLGPPLLERLASSSRGACSPRPGSRRRPAPISTAAAATATCASPSPEPRPTWPRRWTGSAGWLR